MSHHTTPGVTRRSVLVGACAACGVAVAGCAGYGKPAPAAPPPPPPPPAVGGGPPGLVATKDVPLGSGVILKAQKVVVTQPTAGDFKAFDIKCTHQGCDVTEITPAGTIKCPCHDSEYDISDASVVAGPAPQPLKTKAITVKGDAIFLA